MSVRCIRVRLNDGEVYFLTNKQWEVLQEAYKVGGTKVVLGGRRTVTTDEIRDVNMNYFLSDEETPDYLKGQTEREGEKDEVFLSPSEVRMRKLPTELVLLTMDWQPITKEYVMPKDGDFMKKGEKFTAIMGGGHEEPEGYDEWYMARAHYEIRNGRKEYFLKPEQLKEVFFMRRDNENPRFPYMIDTKIVYGDVRKIKEKK